MANRRSPQRELSKPKKVLTYVVMIFILLGLCGLPLARGHIFYQSYWGGAVFVPTILLIAAITVVAAIRVLTGKK